MQSFVQGRAMEPFMEGLAMQSCANGSTMESFVKRPASWNQVWKTHTMESLIYRLRKKIEDDPNQPRRLVQIDKKYYLRRD